MTLQEAVHQGTKLLEDARIRAPRLTAEVLLSHAIGCRREWLYSHSTDELKELWWIHYGRYLHERLKGKPTQYITHVQEFYGRPFRVTPAVLIPRPETEHLVEAALARLMATGPVIDVGTGSGAIAVSLALESKARVFASDLSQEALEVARGNASKLGAEVSFLRADLLKGLGARSMQMVVSNPPYIPLNEQDELPKEVREHEPHLALFGGEDGLVNYRLLIAQATTILRPEGWLLMELAYNGAAHVQSMLEASGCWTGIELIADLAGHPRVIAASLRTVRHH
jgi:release factor glutamine methyltransferase